jgi:hypothetical protein
MEPTDSAAFDAVMLDVMSALMAIPEIGVKDPRSQVRIVPVRPRADRLGQLEPDVRALHKFFGRLTTESRSAADRKLLRFAQEQVQRMLKALPGASPIVSRPVR